MNRVRISTTVDATLLETARRMVGAPDSRLLDRALKALIDEAEEAHELAALAALPYEDDPDLNWAVAPAADLPYEGEVPAEVVRIAKRRRRSPS